MCSLLQVSVEERLSSSMMLFEAWPNTQPITRPSLIQPGTTKYTVEKCLPLHTFPVYTPAPVSASFPAAVAKDTARKTVCATAQSTRSKPPLVAKIGACGRKIADAVRHVGHHKSLPQHVTVNVTECSGIPERVASANQSVDNHSFSVWFYFLFYFRIFLSLGILNISLNIIMYSARGATLITSSRARRELPSFKLRGQYTLFTGCLLGRRDSPPTVICTKQWVRSLLIYIHPVLLLVGSSSMTVTDSVIVSVLTYKESRTDSIYTGVELY